MSLFIAVGGTGQHVAAAAARLAHIGALQKPTIFILDADDGGGLTTSLVTFGGTSPDGLLHHPAHVKVTTPLPSNTSSDRRFKDLFESPSDTVGQMLFEAFFDAASEDVRIQHGMYGNPAVGSVVFGHGADAIFDELVASAQNNERVFVVGSFVGGTGAGVLHQLLRRLHTRELTDKTYLAALLPWHQPPSQLDNKAPIHLHSMQQNMRYGTEYLFERSRKWVQNTCLLGLPQDGANSGIAGAKVQLGKDREYPHILHAYACHYFLTAHDMTVKHNAKGGVSFFHHDSAQPEWLLDQAWHGDRTLRWYLQRAQWAAALVDYVGEIGSQFRKSWGWIGPKKTTYNLHLYNTVAEHAKRLGVGEQALCDDVLAELLVERKALQYSLDWFASVFGALPPSPVLDSFQGSASKAETLQKVARDHWPTDATTMRTPREIAIWFRDEALNSFPGGV